MKGNVNVNNLSQKMKSLQHAGTDMVAVGEWKRECYHSAGFRGWVSFHPSYHSFRHIQTGCNAYRAFIWLRKDLACLSLFCLKLCGVFPTRSRRGWIEEYHWRRLRSPILKCGALKEWWSNLPCPSTESQHWQSLRWSCTKYAQNDKFTYQFHKTPHSRWHPFGWSLGNSGKILLWYFQHGRSWFMFLLRTCFSLLTSRWIWDTKWHGTWKVWVYPQH